MEANNGKDNAIATFALEATFNGGTPYPTTKLYLDVSASDLKHSQPNTEYTITHPYGKDKIKTDAEGEINYTEDIGAGRSLCRELLTVASVPF